MAAPVALKSPGDSLPVPTLSTLNLMADFGSIADRGEPVWLADRGRHLVAFPYGLPELHAMAAALGLGRRWFHAGRAGRHPHYDIPKDREAEILARCTLVRPRDILWVIRGGPWPRPGPPPGPPVVKVVVGEGGGSSE